MPNSAATLKCYAIPQRDEGGRCLALVAGVPDIRTANSCMRWSRGDGGYASTAEMAGFEYSEGDNYVQELCTSASGAVLKGTLMSFGNISGFRRLTRAPETHIE